MNEIADNVAARTHPDRGGFRVLVADSGLHARVIRMADPKPTGRQILSEAGLDPAGDYILIRRLERGTRSVGLDELVDVRSDGEAFVAFESDRLYTFTVDERGYEWGTSRIAETALRELATVPVDEVLILQREGADRELGPEDRIALGDAGTEHLRTEKRLITVSIDGEQREVARGTYTTEQLIDLLGVQAGYLLNVIGPDGQLMTLQPGETLRVRTGMKFISQVPGGGSS